MSDDDLSNHKIGLNIQRVACLLAGVLMWVPMLGHAEGPGVRAGDLVFHPQAWVAGGYDSNVFRESAKHREGVNEAVVLRAGGGLSMRNRSPNKIALSFDTQLTYRHFAAVNALDDVSVDLIASRNGVSDASANAKIGFFPKSVITLEISDDFRYSERPPYNEVDGAIAGLRRDGKFDSILGFEKINNGVGVELAFRPGSGNRPIELRLGYKFRIIRFLDGEFVGASRGNRNTHEISLLSRWRFLPKTAAEFKVDFHIHDYEQPPLVVALNADGSTQLGESADRDSSPLRLSLGLRGLITKRMSALIQLGYSNSFNAAADSYSMIVGKAELQYVLEPTLTTKLGYEHDMRPSAFSNYVVVDRVYGAGELHFLRGFTLGASAGIGYYQYAIAGAPEGRNEAGQTVPQDRTDPVVRSKVRLAYNIRNWLTAEGSWQLESNLTEYKTRDLGGNQPDYADYNRQLLMFVVRAVY